MTNEKTIGYTAGAFDIFPIGHLNLLRRSKENCDHLIVGVTTDELIRCTKKRNSIMPFSERIEIVSSIRYVDEVVKQDDLDKVLAWKKYHYDKLFSGDDWKGNPRWVGYENELRKVGADVIYFPYTQQTSSIRIQHVINNIYGDLHEIE
jgi:glycerol-3-phosphate cytidylyltransferase